MILNHGTPCSERYTGRISDEGIVNVTEFLDILQPFCSLTADKIFNIFSLIDRGIINSESSKDGREQNIFCYYWRLDCGRGQRTHSLSTLAKMLLLIFFSGATIKQKSVFETNFRNETCVGKNFLNRKILKIALHCYNFNSIPVVTSSLTNRDDNFKDRIRRGRN